MNTGRSFRVVGDDLLFDGEIVARFRSLNASLMDDLTLILDGLPEKTPDFFVPYESEPSDS